MNSLRFKLITRRSTSSTQILVSSLRYFLQTSAFMPLPLGSFSDPQGGEMPSLYALQLYAPPLCNTHHTPMKAFEGRAMPFLFVSPSPSHSIVNTTEWLLFTYLYTTSSNKMTQEYLKKQPSPGLGQGKHKMNLSHVVVLNIKGVSSVQSVDGLCDSHLTDKIWRKEDSNLRNRRNLADTPFTE